MNDVVAAFNEYFEVIDAHSPELLRNVFHLRYQVYCIEQRAPGLKRRTIPRRWKAMIMTATHLIYFCGIVHLANLSERRA